MFIISTTNLPFGVLKPPKHMSMPFRLHLILIHDLHRIEHHVYLQTWGCVSVVLLKSFWLPEKSHHYLLIKQLPNPLPPNFKLNQYCAYHQSTGHLTDDCFTLRIAIKDLLRKRVIVLKPHPNVTTNPLPTHITTPPLANLNLIDLDDPLESSIHMMSWDT